MVPFSNGTQRKLRLSPMLRLLFVCAVTTFATGCGPSGPETFPVAGKLLYKGQPVEGATIVFQPAGDSIDLRPAGATSAADGTFSLTTIIGSQTFSGAIASDYVVAVEKDTTKYESLSNEEYAKIALSGRDPIPKRNNVLPEKYANPATSNLRYAVTADGENNFTIELVD